MAADKGTPTEAFETLGHETRLAIVETLAGERRTNWVPAGLSFSELRKSVGVEDAGKFNYHLGELLGTFVYKNDDDEYVLTNAGFELAGAVLSGAFTDRCERRSATIDETCVVCDEPIEAIYRDGYVSFECPDHDRIFATVFPSGAAAGREMETVARLADLYARHYVERTRNGGCPHCWGEMRPTLPATVPEWLRSGGSGEQTTAEFRCERCEFRFWLPASVCVVRHPAVVSLYHDHGIDVRDRRYTGLEFVTGDNGAVVSEDPVRVRVDVELGDDRLELSLDERTTVVDVERY